MKKRIAHIAGGLTTGGVEAVIYNYFSKIDRKDYELYYITYDTPDPAVKKKFEDIGFHVYEVTKKKENLKKSCKEVYTILKENHINIVHSHMTLMSFVTSFLGKFCGIKVRIAHSHLALYPTGIKKPVYAFFKFCTRVTSTDYMACGKKAGEYLYGKANMKNGRVRIMNNAIDTEKYAYNEEIRNKKREELQIGDRFCIGHVGRFAEQKNHAYLIDIFYEVHKKKEDAVLLLVGDGPLQEDVKARVHQYGLDDAVIFAGSRDDVGELYQAMDLFVLPSLFEGLALVLVETQCAGLRILVSDAVTDEIKMTDRMEYLPLHDKKVWVNKILSMTEEIKEENLALRSRGREEVAKSGYDIMTEAKKLDRFYEKRLEGRR